MESVSKILVETTDVSITRSLGFNHMGIVEVIDGVHTRILHTAIYILHHIPFGKRIIMIILDYITFWYFVLC